MSNKDMENLAKRINTMDRKISNFSRSAQLPQSSVLSSDGEDIPVAGAIESARDTVEDVAIVSGLANGTDENLDLSVDYTSEIPDWIEEVDLSAEVAWDSTQFAVDLAQELEVTIEPLPGQVADAVQKAAQAEITATLANGRLTVSPNAPASSDGAGKPTGALWMQKTANQVSKLWEWTGSAWQERPLSETIIPKIAIGEGTYGELNGARLMAKTIVADKVFVGNGQNEAWDPAYSSYNTSAWGSPTGGPGSGWVTDVVRPGMNVSQKLTERAPGQATMTLYSAIRGGVNVATGVNTDRLYYVGDKVGKKITGHSHWMADKAPSGGMTYISTRAYFYNAAGTQFSNQSLGNLNRADITPNQWYRVGGEQVTIPEGALFVQIRPTVYFTANTTDLNGTNYYLGGEELYNVNAGELIVDGGIQANHLAAGSVIAGKLAAGSIDGMVITGATIRTAPTGRRVQLDVNGLRTFNDSNVETAKLTSDEGGLLLTGSLTSWPGGNTPRAVLDGGQLAFDYPQSFGIRPTYLGPHGISSNSPDSRLAVWQSHQGDSAGVDIMSGDLTGKVAGIRATASDGQVQIYGDMVNDTGNRRAPYAMAAGELSVTPVANQPTFATVTFPAGRFTNWPVMSVAANSTVIGSQFQGVSFSNATASSVRIYVYRTNTTSTNIHWTATQMRPTTSPG